MDYSQERSYLRHGRMLGLLVAALLFAVAATGVGAGAQSRPLTIAFALIVLALAASIFYAPDYLHVTVNPEKRPAWQLKIRRRLLALALMLGLLSVSIHSASNLGGGVLLVSALIWLGAYLIASAAVPPRWFAAYFWATDFLLLAALLLRGSMDLMLAAALLAAAAHLSIVIADKRPLGWAAAVTLVNWLLLFLTTLRRAADLRSALPAAALVALSALATGWLVRRAQTHHAANIAAALRDLTDFTGYPEDRIRQLWATSNQELARAWQQAAIPQDDRERMAQWYRDHSELYLFAISAYNLEYKRMRSNLRALARARGACLDYGAGDGELILALARQGHPAAYFDVEGVTMKFARRRAQRLGLAVDFFSSKPALAEAARRRSFDTVLSFDVLEHIPDLPGELDFLSSLLNPGGLLAFDVPAGSTRSHPMHLNHALDVRAHLRAKGMQDGRSPLQRLFSKRDRYAFRVPAT